MANTQETIADIIAEMRGMGNYQRYSGDYARVLANRLEAARRREVATTKESLAVGNSGDCAKLREALKKIDKIVWDKNRHTKEEAEAHRIATEVLTAVHSTSPEPIGGNAAKLREALENCANMGEQIDFQLGSSDETVYTFRDERCLAHNISECARAALAAPARNCDRFGGDIDKLREACARERGLNPEEDFPDVFQGWLFSPATEKEGGAK